jgi:hypothetical protein
LILQVAVNNLNDNIVFIFDLGTAGSANSTYYFDDVSQSAVALHSIRFWIFNNCIHLVDDGGGNKIANPDKTGVNKWVAKW